MNSRSKADVDGGEVASVRKALQILFRSARSARNGACAQGHVIDWQENERGVCCVAVPLPRPPGRNLVSLSVSGPSSRLFREDLHAFVPRLIDAARGPGLVAAAPRALVAL